MNEYIKIIQLETKVNMLLEKILDISENPNLTLDERIELFNFVESEREVKNESR